MTHEEIKALDNDHEVCLCMNVTLGEIIEAIKNGHDTVEKIMDETDAGTVCELCQSKEVDEDDERELHLSEILEFVKSGS